MTDGAQLTLEQLTCLKKKIINLKFEIVRDQVGVEEMLMLR
jgi:hypothetical protein